MRNAGFLMGLYSPKWEAHAQYSSGSRIVVDARHLRTGTLFRNLRTTQPALAVRNEPQHNAPTGLCRHCHYSHLTVKRA